MSDDVKVFDWGIEFPHIMNRGGFDVVVGNPPYVCQEILGKEFKSYAKNHYQLYASTADLYVYFIERSRSLLKEDGYFSIIVANKWMRAGYGSNLRTWLTEQYITEIIDFGDLPVFDGATTYTCILTIQNKQVRQVFDVTQVDSLSFSSLKEYVAKQKHQVDLTLLDKNGWNLSNKNIQELIQKLQQKYPLFDSIVNGKIFRGILTGLDKAFAIEQTEKDEILAFDPSSAEFIKPYLAGKDIKRYVPPKSQRYVIVIPSGWTKNRYGDLEASVAWEKLSTDYKGIARHLASFAEAAKKRYDQGEYWWELRPCEYYSVFEQPKLLYLKFQVKPAFTYDVSSYYANSAVWLIPNFDEYLVGLLNSKMGWFLISNFCTRIQNGYQLIYKYMQRIPIRVIDFNNDTDTKLHSKIVKHVQEMLDLHEQLSGAEGAAKRTIEKRINAIDHEIDQLVYDLYELTPEEIEIVESQN